MERIVVLDFGGQYTHLIGNRIRNLGVFSEIRQPERFDPAQVEDLVGVIFSGGPHSVTDKASPTVGFDVRKAPVPILGLCYGHQLLAKLMGGSVSAGMTREYGPAKIRIVEGSPLFEGLPSEQDVWMSHGDHVSRLPEGCAGIASSGDLAVAGFEDSRKRIFGLQFHPEVTHTRFGNEILDRFVRVCTTCRSWNPKTFSASIIDRTRREAGDRKLFLLLSGGVDSLVALEICVKAVGPDRVESLHIDTGLMREGESAEVVRHLRETGFSKIRLVDAGNRFLQALKGVMDPEEKRKVIGGLFVEVLQSSVGSDISGEGWMLVQGTIYPDTIESGGSKQSSKIKTHHNRVAQIEEMIRRKQVIEPLHDLYKDEVRMLGRELGLPTKLVERHPFPGPGLGIRVLCSRGGDPEPGYDREREELADCCGEFHLAGEILPVRSVGVQGDSRSYLHPAVVWSEPGSRLMAGLPEKAGNGNDRVMLAWDHLSKAGIAIVNRLRTVNRVVFSPRPLLHPIRLVRGDVNRDRLDLLRAVDAVVRRETADLDGIWQFPVISLPAEDGSGAPLFVLRPITSQNAMTADFFRMPISRLGLLLDALESDSRFGRMLYDVTPKPPGTIEWE